MSESRKPSKRTIASGIETAKLQSWQAFCDEIRKGGSDMHNSFWRGQRRGDWELVPKLDRLDDDRVRRGRKKEIYEEQLAAFRRASAGRRGNVKRPIKKNEWWALGQHYGLDTPLLDWTRSPFIALFFAFAESTSQEVTEAPCPRAVYVLTTVGSPELASEEPKLGEIGIVTPLSDDNTRLISQAGMFTITHTSESLKGAIAAYLGESGVPASIMTEYSIPDEDREECLKYLNRMNINYATLFPDTEGAARYCNMKLRIKGY